MRGRLIKWVLSATLAAIVADARNAAIAGALYGLDDPDRVPGEFLVTLKRPFVASLANPILSDLNESTRSPKWRVARDAVNIEVGSMAAKLLATHHGQLTYNVAGAAVVPFFTIQASDDDAKAIANEPEVERVDASIYIRNTLLTTQAPAPSWGIDRIDQGDTSSTAILDNSYSYFGTGYGADVYVLDSGIMTSNVDFGRRATNDADFVGDGNPGWCASNLSGLGAAHGTEVASIIGGSTYGVAKQVRLHSVRIANCAGGSSYPIILNGLAYLYDHAFIHNSILNISLVWLSGNLYAANQSAQTTSFISNTQFYLAAMSKAGITIVMASGNGGSTDDPCNSWPQALSRWSPSQVVADMLVGATSYRSDNVWPNTSIGKCGGPDIFAPGDRVTTAYITSASQSVDSGTSLAAPYVSGVAAIAASLGDAGNGSDGFPAGSVYASIYAARYANVIPNICVVHRPAQPSDYCYGSPDVVSALVAGNHPVPGGGNSGGGSGGGGGGVPAAASVESLYYLLLLNH
jgi:hypothetical protein